MKYMLDTNICIYTIKQKHYFFRLFQFLDLITTLPRNTERFGQNLKERERQWDRWIC